MLLNKAKFAKSWRSIQGKVILEIINVFMNSNLINAKVLAQVKMESNLFLSITPKHRSY